MGIQHMRPIQVNGWLGTNALISTRLKPEQVRCKLQYRSRDLLGSGYALKIGSPYCGICAQVHLRTICCRVCSALIWQRRWRDLRCCWRARQSPRLRVS